MDQELGDSNNLSRSAFSLAAPGNFTRADPWAPSLPNDHAYGPLINWNPLQLIGSTFPAGFAVGAADNDDTALPTAPIPYPWEAAAPTTNWNNNAFTPSISSNPSPLIGSTFSTNAAYDAGITYPTAPSPYTLGAAAPMYHYMGPGFNYPNPALPIMDPFAADMNGNAYQVQFPTATSFNTQLEAANEPPTASHATHVSHAAPLVLAQQPPPPPPLPPRPTCAICGRNFRRKADLDRHAKMHRTDARVYRCGCGYNNYRKDKLDEHVRRSGHRAVVGLVSGDGV